MLGERSQRIVLERARGDTLQSIGARHGISYQRVQTIVRDATRHIDHLELELLKARKTGEVVGLAVPYQEQSDRQLALDYFDWVVSRLRSRGVRVRVTHKPTTEGSVLFIEEETE